MITLQLAKQLLIGDLHSRFHFWQYCLHFAHCNTIFIYNAVIELYYIIFNMFVVQPIKWHSVSINKDVCFTKITIPTNMVHSLHNIHIYDFPQCKSLTFSMPSLCQSSRHYVCLWHIHSWTKNTSLWSNSLLTDNMIYPDISDTLTCVCYPVGSAVPHKWISSFPEGKNIEGFKVFTLCVSVCAHTHVWILFIKKNESLWLTFICHKIEIKKKESVRVYGFTDSPEKSKV